MKIILNKYGESLELDVLLSNTPISLGEPHVLIGRHSCKGQMILMSVATDWAALVCMRCNFRKLIPVDVCGSNLIFAKFFDDIIEKTKGNVPRRTFV